MRPALLMVGLLAGCSVVAPTPSLLQTMKENRSAGRTVDNASAAVTCTREQQECYQLRLLKGDACYSLARQAQGARRRVLDDCAASELREGAALMPGEQTPVGDKRGYARKRMEALHDLIDTRRPGDPSAAPDLDAAATAYRRDYKRDPAGAYYLASARLTAAQDQWFRTRNSADLCAALRDIDALAREGNRDPGAFAANLTALADSSAGMRRAGGCP